MVSRTLEASPFTKLSVRTGFRKEDFCAPASLGKTRAVLCRVARASERGIARQRRRQDDYVSHMKTRRRETTTTGGIDVFT